MDSSSGILDLSADAERVKSIIARAEKLAVSLGDSGANRRMVASLTALELRNLKDVCSVAAEVAKIEPNLYASQYGVFLGQAEALGGTVEHIEKLATEGALSGSDRVRAATDLLADGLDHLLFAIDSLGRNAASSLAEHRTLQEANALRARIDELREQVSTAASSLGLGVKQLEWGIYSQAESKAANRWRIMSLASLLLAAAVSVGSAFQLLGDVDSLPQVLIRGVAVLSLAALATYGASQSAEHRREERMARRNALDFVTLMLLVDALDSEAKQEVLRNFGITRFGATVENKVESATPAVPGIVDAIAQVLTKQLPSK
jgi:hypothetical protein